MFLNNRLRIGFYMSFYILLTMISLWFLLTGKIYVFRGRELQGLYEVTTTETLCQTTESMLYSIISCLQKTLLEAILSNIPLFPLLRIFRGRLWNLEEQLF